MTPYELNFYVKSYYKRTEQDISNKRAMLVEQAILISRWVWAKKIKQEDIDKILNTTKKPTENMDDDKLLAQAKMLNAMFGGEIKK